MSSPRARTSCRRTAGRSARRGRNSSSGRSYQASAPCCSNTSRRARPAPRVSTGGAARRAVEGRDRHAPGALARDAPVGTVRDHPLDPLLAPARDPACRRAIASSARARRSFASMAMNHCVGGPEDHRLVAAPAVRVAECAKSSRCHSRPRLGERRFDLRVGLPDLQVRRSARRVVGEAAGVVDRRVDLEPVLDAGDVVSAPWPGAVWTAPVPGLERHVVGEHAERVAIEERMPEDRAAPSPRPGTSPAACRTSRPVLAATAAASSAATMTARAVDVVRRRTRTRDGRRSPGWPGIVHGVVVQISTDTGRPASAGTRRRLRVGWRH